LLREQGTDAPDWPLCLFGSSTIEGIDEVVSSKASLGIVNPSSILNLAYRGKHPFRGPQPVRTLAVIPSHDCLLFAVRKEYEIAKLEDIAARRIPLRIAMRGQSDHCVHLMFEHIAACAGFSIEQLIGWGGSIHREGHVPRAGSPQLRAFDAGAVDAIVDEGVGVWIDQAIDRQMTVLSLSEDTVRKLEAMGYRRAVIEKAVHPRLPGDVLTIDFSGWPIFVHDRLQDDIVTKICAALDARKDLIPWEHDGPLPVERMCRDGVDTPMDVPLHPAAERYWRQMRYI
jgi:TRAP-type uncharacterized transport system substrate-binding protein